MSAAAFRIVQSLDTDGVAFATVIDVGANMGQFARAAIGRWPEATVISFEALPEEVQLLEAALATFPQVEVHAVAVGATDGTTMFYPHRHRQSSSALRVTPSVSGERWAHELPATVVPQQSLDTVFAGRSIERPALLKIDVQGYEMEVVSGGGGVLRQVDAIVIEVAFEARYEGQPTFSAVVEAMHRVGWSFIRPLDFSYDDGGQIAEVDCLFLPSRPS
jgi:FkbM family methyltransferase